MTRHLFLLRHGKSAWPEGVADHERLLAPRGEIAVPLVARQLGNLAPRLDLVLVSGARRTRETFQALAGVIPGLAPVTEPRIYDAQPGTLLSLVQDLPDRAKTVLMVGHNPGFHALALFLASEQSSERDGLRRLERKLPTAGLIHLEWAGRWDEADQGVARLVHFITPAMLGGIDED